MRERDLDRVKLPVVIETVLPILIKLGVGDVIAGCRLKAAGNRGCRLSGALGR